MLENMVNIARFPTAVEADAARNRLGDSDIPVCLVGEALATWYWYLVPVDISPFFSRRCLVRLQAGGVVGGAGWFLCLMGRCLHGARIHCLMFRLRI